eukprot:CAMPEP_0197237610 /NCGR_PEP_ID=MMETSP1429-20130617/4399_1 /TAXON_ID=49237 /ORGANISM="Chaetoceros  sp., Strain UNC1202" /LENGTH=172 /DNA_ID=CAMNT_0042696643 /DNA_START=130 /DNA_END=648 /DNA_ORIENTATION=+
MLAFVAAGTTSAFSPVNLRAVAPAGVTSESSAVRRIPTTSLSATFEMDELVMMPSTIERTNVDVGGSPAVLDRPAVEKNQEKSPSKERKSTGSGAWEVRIYNDGKNTREFVARCLVQIVGVTEFTAYQTMMQAHQNGLAVVGTYVYEVAEMYYGALKKNGIVCDLVPVDEEK